MKILIILFSLLTSTVLDAQSDSCQSFNRNGLAFSMNVYKNPAFIGAESRYMINSKYRMDMPGISPHSSCFDNVVSLAFGRSQTITIGALYNVNNQHFDQTKSHQFASSVKFEINPETEIRWGSSVYYNERNFDLWKELSSLDQDPLLDYYPDINIDYFDFNTGVWFVHKNFFSAFSVCHLEQFTLWHRKNIPYYSELKHIPRQLFFSSGIEWNINSKIALYPSFEFENREFSNSTIKFQTDLIFHKNILAGFALKPENYVQFNAGYTWKRVFQLTASTAFPVKGDMYDISPLVFFETGLKLLL